MDLSTEEESALKRLIIEKYVEKDGEITEDDKHEIATDFLKARKQQLPGKSIGQENVFGSHIQSSHCKDIHEMNVSKIYRLVDKIEKGDVDGDIQLLETVERQMPDKDIWDFSLGDKVIIDLPYGKFKFIQKQTLGWRKQLGNLIGQTGYVVDIHSKYDPIVAVYFPDILTQSQLYAGVLKKTAIEFRPVPSRWKVGDYVQTKKHKKAVKKCQKGLPDIPEKYIGVRKGRVIAVASTGVFVTFNERSSYTINPAALQSAVDNESIFSNSVTNRPKKFSVGDKVRVLKDIRKLIENQKGFGGWNWKMSSLAGTDVTIFHIKRDGSLIIAVRNGRSWRLNYESVYSVTESEHEDTTGYSLPFLPGNVVRLRLPTAMKVQLEEANVLQSCIEFLKLPGLVEGIDDDFDVVVRFSNGKKRIFNPNVLQNVSAYEKRKYQELQKLRSNLLAGSRVRIAAGPERYVKEIARKIKMNQRTCEALTEKSVLLGFTDEFHAVIQYDNGRKIKMATKYLTPAEEFYYESSRKINFESLKSLIEFVELSLSKEMQDEGGTNISNRSLGNVDIFSITTGSPPTVCLRINNSAVDCGKVIKYLQTLTTDLWDIRLYGEDECHIKMENGEDVYVMLLAYGEGREQCNIINANAQESRIEQHADLAMANIAASDTSAAPMHRNRDIEIDMSRPQESGAIPSWEEMRFFKFRMPGGTVCIPVLPDNAPARGGTRQADVEVHGDAVISNIIAQGEGGITHIQT